MPPLFIALQLLFLTLLVIGLVLVIASLIVSASARRAREFVLFERRADLGHRLMFAAIGPFLLDLFLEAPVIGGPFAVLVGTWLVWCLQPSQRRVDVSAEAMFRSPPEAVASVMFDVSQQPRWMESIKAASLVTPGLLRVGSVIRQTAIVAGTDLAATLRVNELVPYQRLALALEGSPSDTIDVLEVAAQDGGSLVTFRGTHRISFAVAVLTGWRTPSLRRAYAKNRAASLERLRALVDRAAPSRAT